MGLADKSWSDYVTLHYEYKDRRRRKNKPVVIKLPKLKRQKPVKLTRVFLPDGGSEWIHDLSEQVKSKQ